MTKSDKKKPILVKKRLIGMKILHGGRCPTQAYAIYEHWYSDGTVKVDRGQSLRTLPNVIDISNNPAERKKSQRSLRSDLQPVMEAAGTLLDQLEQLCWELDNPGEKREF